MAPLITHLLIKVCLFYFILSLAYLPVLSKSTHNDNWAVIVSTSKYWFNYRHNADALTFYHAIKRQGIPDDHIILMLPEDVACSAKNIIPGHVINQPNISFSFPSALFLYNEPISPREQYAETRDFEAKNLYNEETIQVDYKGDEVTVDNFLRILTNRHDPYTPRNKRLLSNKNSNILFYLSGHGGDQFLKFRDEELLSATDFAFALQELYIQQRMANAFVIIETCQASTLVETIVTPNVITLASSKRDENSYSYGYDHNHGFPPIDRFTYQFQHLFRASDGFTKPLNIAQHSRTVRQAQQQGRDAPPLFSVGQFLQSFPFGTLHSTAVARTDLYENPPISASSSSSSSSQTQAPYRSVLDLELSDFFGASHHSATLNIPAKSQLVISPQDYEQLTEFMNGDEELITNKQFMSKFAPLHKVMH